MAAAGTDQPGQQPAGATGPTGPADPAGAVPAGTPEAPGTQQSAGPAGPTGAAGEAEQAGPAGPAGPGVTRQPSAGSADPAGTSVAQRRAPAGPAGASRAQESRRPASPADPAGRVGDGARCARAADPAVTEQPAAIATVGSGPRGPVGAVADQRAPRGRQQRRVDDGQQLLQRAGVGRFRGGIAAGAGAQGRHELVGKDPHLGTELLIGQAMAGKLRRDRRRHLVLGRGHDRCYPGSGGRIGRIKGRIQACQIVCGGLHHAGHHVNKRHVTPPLGRYTRAAARISIDTLGKLDPTADAV
ncbi:hypothetical protein MSS2_03096 [Mycobacterium marinum]|nr:hypothetical protein MSS2_03096 [Mycobacterium marinum]